MKRSHSVIHIGRISILFSVLVVVSTNAQGLAGRVAVVSMGRVLQEAPQTQIAIDALQQEFSRERAEILTMQSTYQANQERFQRDYEVMGREERATTERDLREAERNLIREQEVFQGELDIRRNDELLILNQLFVSELHAYAQEQEYELVVEQPIYFSATLDITEDFLTALRERFERDESLGLNQQP